MKPKTETQQKHQRIQKQICKLCGKDTLTKHQKKLEDFKLYNLGYFNGQKDTELYIDILCKKAKEEIPVLNEIKLKLNLKLKKLTDENEKLLKKYNQNIKKLSEEYKEWRKR